MSGTAPSAHSKCVPVLFEGFYGVKTGNVRKQIKRLVASGNVEDISPSTSNLREFWVKSDYCDEFIQKMKTKYRHIDPRDQTTAEGVTAPPAFMKDMQRKIDTNIKTRIVET
ncbi:hypothetical protein H4S07_007170, partial [Coemansia furcata]